MYSYRFSITVYLSTNDLDFRSTQELLFEWIFIFSQRTKFPQYLIEYLCGAKQTNVIKNLRFIMLQSSCQDLCPKTDGILKFL